MGASSSHPHGQIWATSSTPVVPGREAERFREFRRTQADCLLCRYALAEVGLEERCIALNDSFLAVVPFWAVWPYETLVIARRHMASMLDFGPGERDDLAGILSTVCRAYDALFATEFPYSMGFHQAHDEPLDSHFHAHFFPPLLRSASVRKFMVGYELLGEPQRDLTPELAADHLRRVVST